MFKESLQKAEKRRQSKGKGKGKDIEFQMNAEFQRIAKRDNKAFLSQQMQREENNRMGKARNLFKKIKDSQGTVYAKIGT